MNSVQWNLRIADTIRTHPFVLCREVEVILHRESTTLHEALSAKLEVKYDNSLGTLKVVKSPLECSGAMGINQCYISKYHVWKLIILLLL